MGCRMTEVELAAELVVELVVVEVDPNRLVAAEVDPKNPVVEAVVDRWLGFSRILWRYLQMAFERFALVPLCSESERLSRCFRTDLVFPNQRIQLARYIDLLHLGGRA